MTSAEHPLLMIFVKFPEPGRVKTRLAAALGNDEATAIYRKMVSTVLDQLASDQSVRILYDNFRPESDYRAWLTHPALDKAQFVPQSNGDLGQRLIHAFQGAFNDGWQRVGVIGSDCIELTSAIYRSAWSALEDNDLVIGPTYDGGYYFLAMKKCQPTLFANIHWSSGTVLQETLQAADESSMTVGMLTKLHDIDTQEDWQRVLETRI